jgi:MFS family permease
LCNTGGIPPYIYRDIGGSDRWIWFVLANLLSLAAICPFVGAISDLIGRRYVAIVGAAFLILGMIVSSTAHTMNIFIGRSINAHKFELPFADPLVAGMTFAGIGAGINELTALAVASELAPTRKRGQYVAVLVFTIVPFCPSVLWGQLIASHSTWRYVGLFCGLWAFIGLVMTAVFYFPPPRVNSTGLSRREIIQQIDFVGGFLSIAGMILFLAGILWGGYQVRQKMHTD